MKKSIITLSIIGLSAISAGLISQKLDASGASGNIITRHNGASANTGSWSELAGFSLSVWENNTRTTSETYLSYNRHETDPSSYRCDTFSWECEPGSEEWCEPGSWEHCRYTRWSAEYGWGTLPGNAFRATGAGAVLRADVNAGNFYLERCNADDEAGTFECSIATGGGQIDVEWSKDGKSFSTWSGRNHSTFGKYSYRTHGNQKWDSAAATGSFLGTAFASEGSFGSGQNVTIERVRVR